MTNANGNGSLPEDLQKELHNRITADSGFCHEILAQADFALYVCDPASGRFLYANDAGYHLLGHTPEGLLKTTITEVDTALPDTFFWLEHLKETQAQGSLVRETHHKRKDGSLFPVRTSTQIVRVKNRDYAAYWSRGLPRKEDGKGGETLPFAEADWKQAEKMLRVRAFQQSAVAKMGLKALQTRDPQAVMDEAAQTITRILDTDFAGILELQPDGKNVLLRGNSGWKTKKTGQFLSPVEDHLQTGYILRSSGPVVVDDLPSETRFVPQPSLVNFGVKSGISIPLHVRGKVWGIFGTHTTRQRVFTDDEINIFQSIANILAMAIERGQDEEQLRAKEASLSKAQKIAKLGNWTWDINKHECNCSDECFRIFDSPNLTRFDEDAPTGKGHLRKDAECFRTFGLDIAENGKPTGPFFDLVHPNDREYVHRAFQTALKGGKPFSVDYRIVLPDGSERHVHDEAEIVFNAHGVAVKAVGVMQDITDRKEAEEWLKQSEERYRRLVNNSPDIIYSFSDKRGGIFYSTSAEKIFGYPLDHLYANPFLWNQSIHPDDLPAIGKAIERFARGETFDIEYRVKNAKGQWLWFRDRSIGRRKEGDEYIIDGIASDITERKKAEESGRRLTQILEATTDFVASADPQGNVTYYNQAARTILGIGEYEDIRGIRIPDTHPEWAARKVLEEGIPSAIREGAWQGDTAFLTRDGKEIPASQVIIVHKDKEGKVEQFSTVARDISERKKAEEIQTELRRRYEGLVNNLNIGIYRRTLDGRILDANPAFVNLFDAATKGEIVGANVKSLSTNPSRYQEINARLVEYGFVRNEVAEAVTLKGRKILISLSGVLVKDKDGNVLYDGVVEDITEKRKLEEQLMQAQKMEAVGQLTGGIAHDFNNILSSILGNCYLLNQKAGHLPHLSEHMENIKKAVSRGSNLTKDLLTFGRRQPFDLKVVSLNDIIADTKRLLSSLLRENIQIKTQVAEQEITIKADTVQIEQALINLLTNAQDAMPSGGTITIAARQLLMDHAFIANHGFGEPGAYVLLTVADTGTGMDQETQKHIFEPFFTTKEIGKGTGLGLAMVYSIVKQHGGYIDVHSGPGMGTLFRIYLPLSSGAVERETDSLNVIPGGSETVLLAEDENDVRCVTKALLERAGYTVIEAENGEEAVGKFIANRDRIHLCIFDMIMPKKNGKEAFHEIRKIWPANKVLFMSGYTADLMRSGDLKEDGLNFLPKPVLPEEFLRKVREILTT